MIKNKYFLLGLICLIAAGFFFAGRSGNILKNPQQYTENMSGGDSTPANNETPAGNETPDETTAGNTPVEQSGIKNDTGRYTGQIDNNFIEIRISGVPEEVSARSFMLSEDIKAEFDKYGLKKDDEVSFAYKTNDNNQNIIIEIKKL